MSWVSSNVGGVTRCGKVGISRPFGTIHLSLNTTQDCVLGYFQVAPFGAGVAKASSHADSSVRCSRM